MCDLATSQCVAAIPAGWTGPVALYSGSGPQPVCLGDYPTPSQDFFADLDEGTPSCTCTCDPASGIQCTTAASICYTSNCLGICNTTNDTAQPNTCSSFGSSNNTANAKVNNPAPTNMGSCVHHASSSIPAPTFATQARGCGGAVTTPDGCSASELCAPISPSGKTCIERAGESPCTDAYYTEQHVFYDGADDGRTCSACDCGGATSTCGGEVNFTSANCTILINTVSAGSCGPKNNGSFPNGAIYTPNPQGSCNPVPGSGQVLGSVSLGSAVTFCCH